MAQISIDSLDKNFKVETRIERDGIVFYDALTPPFSLHGLIYENREYVRMPDSVAEKTSGPTTRPGSVRALSKNTAGGRLRFITDSPYIAIKARVPKFNRMPHMPLTGQCGFDLYTGRGKEARYRGSFIPPVNLEDEFESVIDIAEEGEKEITINFPLYNGVLELYIGLKAECKLLPPISYKTDKPIVYYGSSITQGGCASRPGTCYQAIISRELDADHINLGFSGNAKAEDNIADYIASLPMSVFVYDYDHNAPSLEHYEATHERFFLRFREKQPKTPVVFVTRPKLYLTPAEKKRVEIARATFMRAEKNGDKNVYFIEGSSLMALAGDNGTVDGTHPTDLGFYSMAEGMIPTLKKILN